MESSTTLTIFFDGQFWVGVFETTSLRNMRVCKVVFGSEPSDAEINNFINSSWKKLNFSPNVKIEKPANKPNPKKLKKLIQKSLEEKGIGTKSQQAIKLQQEQNKVNRKQASKENKEKLKEEKFEQKQKKKIKKHNGH